uniref:maestro heat-like repeat-containing protein family member 1 n=1 Tax=Pristiophorus japonicus TaxID=55135 RepID=UPI00398EDEB3
MKGVVSSTIKPHLLPTNLLTDAQFGLRKDHSAPHLIAALDKTWIKELNCRHEAKLAHNRREQEQTEGGEPDLQDLTAIEEQMSTLKSPSEAAGQAEPSQDTDGATASRQPVSSHEGEDEEDVETSMATDQDPTPVPTSGDTSSVEDNPNFGALRMLTLLDPVACSNAQHEGKLGAGSPEEKPTETPKMSQQPTGRIGTFLMALLKRLVDNDNNIRRGIFQTIYRLGHHWPEYVLLTCRHYLWDRVWLRDEESTIILNTMVMIVQDNLSFIQHHVADSLIVMAYLRATTLIEADQQSQEAACNLLVAIGLGFTQEVLAVTLEDMKKGYPSHVYMIKTLIRLTSAHVHGMVPLIKPIREVMMPVLMDVTFDYHKSVFAAALSAFSKNILLYMDDIEKWPQTTVTKESFANEMDIAYDLLFNKWLEKTESPLNIIIVEALGYCTTLMPKDSLEIELPRLFLESCFSINFSPNNLLSALETKNPQTRLGALSVLKQLIRAVPSQLERRKVKIVAELKLVLLDNNNNVKKLIVETIGAMALEGYLDLEGGRIMVEFVMKQYVLCTDSCNQIPLDIDEDQVTHGDLSRICEVMMLTLTVLESMEDVLWPFLLHITLAQYTKGLTMVSPCLTQLAKKKLQAGDEKYFLIYKQHTNFPNPQALLTQLLVIAGCPCEGEGRGAAALRLLQAMSLNIHEAIVQRWEEEIPLFVNNLVETSEKPLPQQEWEERLIPLLSKTLETIHDEQWTCQLIDVITQQISISHSYPQQKGFLYKCLGMVLHHSGSTDIKRQIGQMLQSAQHREAVEREGVAVGIGFCSITNFEATFSSLMDCNLNLLKKSRSSLHVDKDQSDLEVDNAKSTLVLCSGYLAIKAPLDLLLSRTENHILSLLNEQLNQLGQRLKEESQDLTLTLSLIKSVTLIARAVQCSSRTFPSSFSRKSELLKYMQQLIEAEPTELLQTPIRPLAMNACLHLVQLNPRLNEADQCQLIKSCLRSIFSLVFVDPNQDQDGTALNPGGRDLYTDSVAALYCLLKQLLLQNLSPEGLQTIYKYVETWIISPREYERERAVDMTSKLLTFYWQELDAENIMAPIDLGAVVGQLLPRCVDPLLTIRQRAMDCLYILLKIQACSEGVNPDEQYEQEGILRRIDQQLASTDTTVLFKGCSELAQLISQHLPRDQLANLLFMLFKGLVDHQTSCSNAAAVTLKAVIKRRGPELEDQLSEILEALHLQMAAITQQEVTLTVLQTFTLLTSQHLPAVVRCLLRFPVGECTSAIWRSVAKKTQLADTSLKQLMQYPNRSVAFSERSHSVTETESLDPLAVTCAVYEMISEPESAEAVNTLYSDLFTALLTHLGSSI